MAKAQIITSEGTRVSIEGTPEEVAALVARIESKKSPPTQKAVQSAKSREKRSKSGPQDHISALIEQGFFKKPQGLGAIKTALEERGYFYAVTSLSPVVLRLVRKRELRRIKEKKLWLYVQ
jgi:hypothetical protein